MEIGRQVRWNGRKPGQRKEHEQSPGIIKVRGVFEEESDLLHFL